MTAGVALISYHGIGTGGYLGATPRQTSDVSDDALQCDDLFRCEFCFETHDGNVDVDVMDGVVCKYLCL